MLRKLNESKKIFTTYMVLLFLGFLVFNIMTPYMVDDFAYMKSFATGERIRNIGDVVLSMKAHYFSMNGRLVVHFIVQILLMLPPIVFDILNALVFCLQIGLIYYFGCYYWSKKHNVLLLIVIGSLIWKFVPAFEQVYLWLDGAVNYLWPTVFTLLYLLPFASHMDGKEMLNKKWKIGLFTIYSILVGASSESLSMAAILITILFILVTLFDKSKHLHFWMFAGLLANIVGYIFMIVSPATKANKLSEDQGLSTYIDNFRNVLQQYYDKLWILLVLWLVLISVAVCFKVKKEAVMFSTFFMLISVALNFMHFVAAYYPERSMLGTTVFLILAIMVLLSCFQAGILRIAVVVVSFAIILLAVIAFIPGSMDIIRMHIQYSERDTYIDEQKAADKKDLELVCIVTDTKYAAINGLRDLSTETAKTWPNASMAKYYEVDSIIGK